MGVRFSKLSPEHWVRFTQTFTTVAKGSAYSQLQQSLATETGSCFISGTYGNTTNCLQFFILVIYMLSCQVSSSCSVELTWLQKILTWLSRQILQVFTTKLNIVEFAVRSNGRYRSNTTQYVSIQLGHIPDLARFLLDYSFFSVGVQVFQQTRGASMGSQWAPILCSAVALQREFIFCEIYGSVQSEWSLAHRYVDNRLLITPRQTFQTLSVQLFWNLSFYTPPIMLEAVEGDEALGFFYFIATTWEKSLRSTRSAGPSGQILSGLLARIRLICSNVFPARLRLAQIQDLLGIDVRSGSSTVHYDKPKTDSTCTTSTDSTIPSIRFLLLVPLMKKVSDPLFVQSVNHLALIHSFMSV